VNGKWLRRSKSQRQDRYGSFHPARRKVRAACDKIIERNSPANRPGQLEGKVRRHLSTLSRHAARSAGLARPACLDAYRLETRERLAKVFAANGFNRLSAAWVDVIPSRTTVYFLHHPACSAWRPRLFILDEADRNELRRRLKPCSSSYSAQPAMNDVGACRRQVIALRDRDRKPLGRAAGATCNYLYKVRRRTHRLGRLPT